MNRDLGHPSILLCLDLVSYLLHLHWRDHRIDLVRASSTDRLPE